MPRPVIINDAQGTPPSGSHTDEWAYIAPMGLFLLLTGLGGWFPGLYPASYVAKTLLTPLVLWYFWRNYTRIQWHGWALGVLVGVVGLIQWVGMEKLLVGFDWPIHFPGLAPNYWRPHVEIYDPRQHFSSASLRWSFVALRWAGATLVVPFMEELFWRDYLWRMIDTQGEFKRGQVGGKNWLAIVGVSALFATVHVQWLTAIAWGLLIAWLLVRTRSLGACIIAHAVTNLLLGLYVLLTNDWYFW